MRDRDVDAVRLRARSGSVKPPQEHLLEPPQEHLLQPPSQLLFRESTPRAISLTSDSSSVRSQGRRLMDEHDEKHAEAGWLPQWVTSMYTSVPQTSLQEDTTEDMEAMDNDHEYDNEHGLDIMNANLDDDEMGEDDDSTGADSTPTTRRRLSSRRRSSLSCPSGQRVEQRAVTELDCDSAGRTSCTYAEQPRLRRNNHACGSFGPF